MRHVSQKILGEKICNCSLPASLPPSLCATIIALILGFVESFSFPRKIIATGHVEVDVNQRDLSSESHRQLGLKIKQYFTRLGINSSTVQIEYSEDSGREEGCKLECPPSETTGIKLPQCDLDSCCIKKK